MKMKILFMCVANSARSQLAEGLAKSIFADRAWIESAGSSPYRVSSTAIEVMREIGIDLRDHHSKGVEDLPREFLEGLNYVVTLCVEEVCPSFITQAKRLHWPMPDPGQALPTHEGQLMFFRQVRDEMKKKIEVWAKEILSAPTRT